jgi:hypothetical protein
MREILAPRGAKQQGAVPLQKSKMTAADREGQLGRRNKELGT